MSWQIEIVRDARKELADLHPQMQARVSKAILALENTPFPQGCKKLKNRDGFRIRVGGLSRGVFRRSKDPQDCCGRHSSSS